MTDSNDLFAEMDRLAALALGQPTGLGPAAGGTDERTVSAHLDLARSTQTVDQMPEGETRLLGFKRTVLRLSRLFLHRQALYNKAMQEAVTLLNNQLADLRARSANEFGRLAASIAHIEASVADLAARLDENASIRTDVDETARRVSDLAESGNALRASLKILQADIDRVVTDLRRTVPPTVSDDTLRELRAATAKRADAFYERFEDTMRGSAESVTSALEAYIADIEARRDLGGPVIDVGCGRGEWLSLMRSRGIEALGIDTNEEAVAACRARDLQAVVADAITYLRELPSDTAIAITGFHIVEHLTPDDQIALVEAALRALKPGGVLILETPNPTNLNVGAASFWSDPTHLRPVNPDYLGFLYSDVGFVGVETRFLHPRDGYKGRASDTVQIEDEVMWALRGPQDFAVIGRKPTWSPPTP